MDRSNYKQVTINVSVFEYNLITKFKKHGFSAREVLEYSSCPCDKCKNINVIVFDKKTGDEVSIPKGILINKR